VRALAEGEQLCRIAQRAVSEEDDKHFELEHEQFFSTDLRP